MASSDYASQEVLLDNKTGRKLTDITKLFKYQASPNSCYTTCIYNIMNDLAIVHDNKDIAFSEKRINRICRFKDYTGPQLDIVAQNLSNVLKDFSYRAQEKNQATYNNLTSVLEDQKCSYPLIGLSYKYLEVEQKVKFPEGIQDNPDHVVIVLMVNSERIAFFDPYAGIRRDMRQADQGYGRGVVALPTPRISDDYWQNASDTSWMFWIKGEKAKSERMESYFEVKNHVGGAS